MSLSWSAPTTNASTVTGYQVLRRVGIDAEGVFSELGTTGARETTYVDDGFEAGQTYAYRVKARRGDRLSASSNTATVDVPPCASGAGEPEFVVRPPARDADVERSE